MGVGSSSIMLIFAVLCLTVFSLISLSVAGNDKALADAEANLVTRYYEADALAESVLAELIRNGGDVQGPLYGMDIESSWDWDLEAQVAAYRCTVSEVKDLYVRVVFTDDGYSVLAWKLVDTDEWTFDDSLNVWSGEEGDFGFGMMDMDFSFGIDWESDEGIED
jgi:hypothetical protein